MTATVAAEAIADDYGVDEARQVVVLVSIECTECGADAYAEGLCHLCRLEMEKRS